MTEDDWIDLYRRSLPKLYRAVSRRVGGERSLAEDVTQEAWLRALENWRRAGLPDDPHAWLVTVASNLLRNHFRRPVPAGGVDDVESDVVDDPVAARRAAAVQRGLARLRPEQAALLAERHFDGRSLAQIADDRGTTERAVEGRLRRARRALSRHIDPDLTEEL